MLQTPPGSSARSNYTRCAPPTIRLNTLELSQSEELQWLGGRTASSWQTLSPADCKTHNSAEIFRISDSLFKTELLIIGKWSVEEEEAECVEPDTSHIWLVLFSEKCVNLTDRIAIIPTHVNNSTELLPLNQTIVNHFTSPVHHQLSPGDNSPDNWVTHLRQGSAGKTFLFALHNTHLRIASCRIFCWNIQFFKISAITYIVARMEHFYTGGVVGGDGGDVFRIQILPIEPSIAQSINQSLWMCSVPTSNWGRAEIFQVLRSLWVCRTEMPSTAVTQLGTTVQCWVACFNAWFMQLALAGWLSKIYALLGSGTFDLCLRRLGFT